MNKVQDTIRKGLIPVKTFGQSAKEQQEEAERTIAARKRDLVVLLLHTRTNTHKHARARARTHTHTAWQDAGECGDSEILGDALVFFPHVLGRALLLSDVWVLWPPHR